MTVQFSNDIIFSKDIDKLKFVIMKKVVNIMNIVFDANAFYAYYGRKKLELNSITMIDEDKFIKEMNIVKKNILLHLPL